MPWFIKRNLRPAAIHALNRGKLPGCCRLRVCPGKAAALSLMVIALALLLPGCASDDPARQCQAEVKTLSGQLLAQQQVRIIDHVGAFTVITAKQRIQSGPLKSNDRRQFIPSAITAEGYLAQRLSDKKFSLINGAQNRWISYYCP